MNNIVKRSWFVFQNENRSTVHISSIPVIYSTLIKIRTDRHVQSKVHWIPKFRNQILHWFHCDIIYHYYSVRHNQLLFFFILIYRQTLSEYLCLNSSRHLLYKRTFAVRRSFLQFFYKFHEQIKNAGHRSREMISKCSLFLVENCL